MNKIILSNGVKMPSIGMGIYKAEEGQQAIDVVHYGLEAGFRLIDTAQSYGNEKSLGVALAQTNINREDIFVVTKVSAVNIKAGLAKESIVETFEKMNLEYIDLMLLHWGITGYKEAYKALEEFYKQGKIKAIGVSNFQIDQLEELIKDCEIPPMVNQIEINPQFKNEEVVKYCKEKNIVIQAWSPLGGGKENNLTKNELLEDIGKKYNKSAVQVMIRWSYQNGNVVLPRSLNKERIKQNYDIFDFELSKDDLNLIETLNTGVRTGTNPEDKRD